MAGTNLSFPFDAELFNYSWRNVPDLVLTSMIESGAIVVDSEIATMISNGSNFYTVPFYNVLTGTEDVYNGVNSFTGASLTGGSYSGVVYGRMAKWSAISFIKDFNSGADPMAQIVSGVANFYIKARQGRLLGILAGVFGITGNAEWTKHITDISTALSTADDTNKVGATSIADACIKACGDNAQDFSLVIMHSVVASRFANLQLLEYSKYTDASGITRDLPIGTINGKTVIVNDLAPMTASGTASGENDYVTYILGLGAIRYATAPVDVPSEMDRDPNATGGVDMIYTRIRESLAPYGFSFTGDVTTDVGMPDANLFLATNYAIKMPEKSIMMAKIISNG